MEPDISQFSKAHKQRGCPQLRAQPADEISDSKMTMLSRNSVYIKPDPEASLSAIPTAQPMQMAETLNFAALAKEAQQAAQSLAQGIDVPSNASRAKTTSRLSGSAKSAGRKRKATSRYNLWSFSMSIINVYHC